MDKLLLIDYENFRISWIYKIAMDMKQYKIDIEHEENIRNYYVEMFIEKVIKYKNKFNCDRVIICKDAKRKDVWRKELLPSYKENRVYKKDGPMNEAFEIINTDECNKKLNDIMEAYGFKILHDKELEADDFMYLTCKQYGEDHKITIISTDADLIQLQMISDNISQYSIQKEQYLKSLDPKLALMEKILTGDDGDNIPNIGSKRVFNKNYLAWIRENKITEDYTDEELIDYLFDLHEINISKFTDYAEEYKIQFEKHIYGNKSHLRMGPKTAAKVIELGVDTWIEEKIHEHGQWLMDRYELNTSIIDLSKLPDKYKEKYKDLDVLSTTKLTKRKLFLLEKKYGLTIK